ncbi:MAG: hypothetical protein V7709_11100 [Halioglobus sp.]
MALLPLQFYARGNVIEIFKRKHRGYGDTLLIDEVFIRINGRQHDLWWDVDQEGDMLAVRHPQVLM